MTFFSSAYTVKRKQAYCKKKHVSVFCAQEQFVLYFFHWNFQGLCDNVWIKMVKMSKIFNMELWKKYWTAIIILNKNGKSVKDIQYKERKGWKLKEINIFGIWSTGCIIIWLKLWRAWEDRGNPIWFFTYS